MSIYFRIILAITMQRTAKFSENSFVSQNSNLELGALLSLTHPANYWAHICPYCSKDFPSSYALGGHQNAHRRERMEEKRLYIKDPLSYRKRAYRRSIRSLKLVHDGPKASPSGGNLSGVLHANGEEESGYVVSPVAEVLEFPCRSGHACGNSTCHPYSKPSYLKPMPFIHLNLFLGGEFISVDKYSEATVLAAKRRALSGGSGIAQRLDLTLGL